MFPCSADTQPCDGPPSRLHYFDVKYNIGVLSRPKTESSPCCHFNHMFHAAACCVFKLIFHPSRHPAHPVSVRLRHPRDKSSLVTSFKTDIYMYKSQVQYKIPGTSICARYTHACGVRVVFLEHGGGALGIFKSPVCTCDQSIMGTFVRLT